jgi:transposase
MAMKAIPVAIRERILALYDQGRSTAEIAASFGYCVAAVRRVRQHFKERGTLEPQTHRCGRKTLLTQPRKERLLAPAGAASGCHAGGTGCAVGTAHVHH